MARALLTRESFETLLAFLDEDRNRAGEKYQEIRSRLVKLFECRGVASAEDAADETMDRVARRLAEGEQIRAANPAAYFHGVARNVLREHWAARDRLAAARPLPDELAEPQQPDEEADRRLACLERCLAELPPETRSLIVAYYRRREGSKAEARVALAARLGVSPNALWIRAHRIRTRLEECVRKCLSGMDEWNHSAPTPQEGDP